jgi:hypothetical protein
MTPRQNKKKKQTPKKTNATQGKGGVTKCGKQRVVPVKTQRISLIPDDFHMEGDRVTLSFRLPAPATTTAAPRPPPLVPIYSYNQAPPVRRHPSATKTPLVLIQNKSSPVGNSCFYNSILFHNSERSGTPPIEGLMGIRNATELRNKIHSMLTKRLENPSYRNNMTTAYGPINTTLMGVKGSAMAEDYVVFLMEELIQRPIAIIQRKRGQCCALLCYHCGTGEQQRFDRFRANHPPLFVFYDYDAAHYDALFMLPDCPRTTQDIYEAVRTKNITVLLDDKRSYTVR